MISYLNQSVRKLKQRNLITKRFLILFYFIDLLCSKQGFPQFSFSLRFAEKISFISKKKNKKNFLSETTQPHKFLDS